MKKKLKGAYFFEWLGGLHSRSFVSPPKSLYKKWPEWASDSYVRGYQIHFPAHLVLKRINGEKT